MPNNFNLILLLRNEKLISCILSRRFFVCLRLCGNLRMANYVTVATQTKTIKKQVRMYKLLIYHSLHYTLFAFKNTMLSCVIKQGQGFSALSSQNKHSNLWRILERERYSIQL